MSKFIRRYCATALALALAPHMAFAGVTADDVWQNQLDYLATLGGDLTKTVAREGRTLSVSDATLTYQLPFELGRLVFSVSDFSMTENGDGTVAITHSEPFSFAIVADITDHGFFSGYVYFPMKGHSTIASGTPGDVTYTYSVDHMELQSRDIEIRPKDPAHQSLKDATLTATGTATGSFVDLYGTFRIKVAEHVTTTSKHSSGKHSVSFGFEDATGRFTYSSGADSFTASGQSTLPRNGMDIMNLAAALRDGLAFSGSSRTIGHNSSQITEEKGEVVARQSSRTQEQSVRYDLDQTGLRVTGTALDTELVEQAIADLPLPIRVQIEKATGGMTLPLAAASELQDVGFDFALEGMTLAEEMWMLLDPEQTLPRDPMTVSMGLSARVMNKVNWLDFMTVKALTDSGEVPVDLHEMTLHDLTLDMVGARLTGSGSGSFDNTDLESFGGLPRPGGTIDLALTGGNALLDNLVAMGLLTQEDAMGARMAAAIFTNPDPEAGPDALKSRLEMTDEGHILANGQRLR